MANYTSGDYAIPIGKGSRQKSNTVEDCFDYVIVGGGSAGCVLANRLSNNPGVSVLLLEAGKEANWLTRFPAGAMAIAYHKNFSWQHRTQANDELDHRQMDWPRGKVLGGSGSTNGMVYVRGQADDFDHWAEQGNTEWSWQKVLPYFRRLESYRAGNPSTRGHAGPIKVETAEADELGDRFIQACVDAGIPRSADFNSGSQEGVGYYEVNIDNGIRQSSAESYLKPVRARPNLVVKTEAMVTKVECEGAAATGVSYTVGTSQFSVKANKEVLLCGGVINSPQLLELSGIGASSRLQNLGIPVVHNLPGVGENLQDHLGVMVAYQVSKPITFKSKLRPDRLLFQLYRYFRYGKGLLNLPAGYVGAFFKSSADQQRPDMQLHFNPASGIRLDGGEAKMDKVGGVTSIVTPLHPESLGHVHIVSSDPSVHPQIKANYLATDKDRADMISAVKWQRQFFAQPSMQEIVGPEIRPGRAVQTDSQIAQYIRQTAITNYHPVGSCKMGSDPMAVVDQTLRVHGVQNLRVVDASVMPTLVSGNTNAATMMIAERAAEMILENT